MKAAAFAFLEGIAFKAPGCPLEYLNFEIFLNFKEFHPNS